MSLSSTLDFVRQRTGIQDLFTRVGLTAFQNAVKKDISSIRNQWNLVVVPLLGSVAEPSGVDALVLGLGGNTLWSDIQATTGGSAITWDSTLGRRRTIKESFDYLSVQLSKIAKQGASETAQIPYSYVNALAFSDVTQLNDLVTILSLGSGAFSLSEYPDLTGVVFLSDDSGEQDWALASAVNTSTGAGALKAIQLQTTVGTKYMLHKGVAVIDSDLWTAGPTSVGEAVYLSATAGELTNVLNVTAGQTVQFLGWVLNISGDNITVCFDMQSDYITN